MRPKLRPALQSGLLALMAALMIPSSWAQTPRAKKKRTPIEWSFHGQIFTSQYSFVQGPDAFTTAQNNLSLWPEIGAKFNERWSARAWVAAQVFRASLPVPNQFSTQAEVREAYLSYQNEGIDIKAGQLIVPWGRSDGVNPTDYFTAKDYTFFTPDDELRRRGELSFWFSWTPNRGDSPWNLQFVAQARYPQAQLLIPPLNIPSGLTFNSTPPSSRYFHPGDVTAGGRAQYLGTDWDFSISAYRGTSLFPMYQLYPLSSTIAAFHPQQTAIGADASFNWGESTVVRAETALLLPDNGTDTDPNFGLVQPQHWDLVLGLERALGESFRVHGQVLIRYHLYFREVSLYNDGNPTSTAIQRSIGQANALLLNFPAQLNPGGTVRVSYAPPSGPWSADVSLIGYLAVSSHYLVRPALAYRPIDDLKLSAGAEIYGGDRTKTLGALQDRSVMFGEIKYYF
jgi:hypothetical protein